MSISPLALNIMIPDDNVPEPIETIAARVARRAERRAAIENENNLARQAAMERIKGPIRIRPLGKYNLALEMQIDQEHIAHHQRRRDEEIAAVRSKFAHGRHRARVVFSNKTDKLQEKYKKSVLKLATGDKDDWELLRTLSDNHGKLLRYEADVYQSKMYLLSSARLEGKIAYITKRRAELAWTCPNDGKAYPFTWEGRQYHRTYDGEMWLSETWEWCGEWAGYYIARGNPPCDDEASQNLQNDLSGW
jgi:hypothetical protein